MNVELYYSDDDPSGVSTWRYHVTNEGADRWEVEVYGGAERFYWIASGKSDRDVPDSGQEPHGTAVQALDAVIADIRRRGAGGADG